MKAHELFFGKCHCWLGQGLISFSMLGDTLKFYARWTMTETSDMSIHCLQEIEIDGMADKMENKIQLFDMNEDKFNVNLENAIWGKVGGAGLVDDKTIAWDFRRQQSGFEGMEVYEKVKADRYLLKAEYISPDMYRTYIQGELWQQ